MTFERIKRPDVFLVWVLALLVYEKHPGGCQGVTRKRGSNDGLTGHDLPVN